MSRPLLSRRVALLSSVAILAAGSVTMDAHAKQASSIVPRRVLALYDGAIETVLKETSVHTLAAMPLEWLGLTLEYHDVRSPLPPIWSDPAYRGVVTWFPEPNLTDYAAYAAWVEKVTAAGLKMVQIGDAAPKPGTLSTAVEGALRRQIFASFGVRALGLWSAVTLGDRVTQRNPTSTEFECRFDGGLPAYELYALTRTDATSWLTVTRADQTGSQSNLVVISPTGGFIAPSYAIKADPETGVKQWFVDPFAFFAAAFGTDDLPAADTTTLCGQRIYYSHIDGDGWRSISQVRDAGRAPATNAEIILRSVIAAHPDLPVTVAPIAAEMDPGFAGDLRAIAAARGMFRHDHVEAATHTYTHPFRWSFFKDYNPASEAPFQDVYRNAVSGRSLVVDASDQLAPGAPGCCGQGSRRGPSPPRAFGGRPFDLNQEVSGAAKLIEAIGAASGKKVRLLQWPGDCSPFTAALRTVAEAGLFNINGGDTRFDHEFPSVSAVAPLGFRRSDLTQIYASNSSEELYTDLWTDRYFGFRDLPETWDRTDAPRRLKPLNLYYHMYSGERRASLDALLGNIEALRARGDYIAITTSDYAAAANGFFSVKFVSDGPATWRVLDRGSLQTVRFTNASQRTLDQAASSGVLGERVINGHLYVALDSSVAEPRVALTARNDGSQSSAVLTRSSWIISGLKHGDDGFSFRARGFGPGNMAWRVAPGRQWVVHAGDETVEATSQADGTLGFKLTQIATSEIDVTIRPSST